ncbi:MAG: GNAT family N-acetyltransferase [Xanthomonadales bacterium]|jgi:RimJ/RimL family protein N-acetyltransferase|nr:GNAT family N-acetyltransferase [Xanthomonadales bacterium]
MNKSARSMRTRRLRLRWITEDDAGLLLAIWNDPDFIRHVGDRGIRTLEEARQAAREKILKHYDEHGYGPYRVSMVKTDEAMGICGLFKRENLEYPDIGYGFLPEFCGRGYAIEAAQAVLDHARGQMNLPQLLAIVTPENVRSTRLLEKLGLRAEGQVRMPGEDQDILLYRIRLDDGQ